MDNPMSPAEVGALREGQRAILRELVDFRQETRLDLKDHEDRLRTIEKWKWQAAGLATAVATVSATLFGAFF